MGPLMHCLMKQLNMDTGATELLGVVPADEAAKTIREARARRKRGDPVVLAAIPVVLQ